MVVVINMAHGARRRAARAPVDRSLTRTQHAAFVKDDCLIHLFHLAFLLDKILKKKKQFTTVVYIYLLIFIINNSIS